MSEDTIASALLAAPSAPDASDLQAFIESSPGKHAVRNLQSGLGWATKFNADEFLQSSSLRDMLEVLQEMRDDAQFTSWQISMLSDDLVIAAGIPAALSELARTLLENDEKRTDDAYRALRRGIELAAMSDLELPKDLRENLVALGMPTHMTFLGRTQLIKTFRDADFCISELPGPLGGASTEPH